MNGKNRFCILCATEIEGRPGLRKKTVKCPSCGAEITMRRTLFGREIYAGQAPGENVIIQTICQRPRRLSTDKITGGQ